MNTPARGARRPLQGAMALVLALSSNAALALGLGDIRVLSQPGQPLLAEIPVVSADPGELEAAKVALASPATFARVGLERPSGLISTLQFGFATDAQGRAVIRVTSPAAVEVPVVSFLIEVDWGRGRLVREYSALVDRPHTAQAIDAPQIQAPSLAPSNAIVREPSAAPVEGVQRVAPSPAPAPAPAPAVAASPVRAAAPAAAAITTADGTLTVQSGQTLSQIASNLARGSNASLDQTMVALLQANPQAFIGGNIHRLRSGARLELPDAQALASVGAAQARAIVREQTGQWQQARAPMPQPAVGESAASAAVADKPAQNTAATTGARLEIAPAAAVDGAATASVSGTQSGAQGDMLVSEQLRQAQEDLATRDAELAELRERVAELEKLREQQSALIALKDNEMAAAQKQVADSAPAPSEGGAGWLWGGGLLLIGAAAAAWFARRRKPSPLPPLAPTAEPGPHMPDQDASDQDMLDQDMPEHDLASAPKGVDAEQMIAALRGDAVVPATDVRAVLPAVPEQVTRVEPVWQQSPAAVHEDLAAPPRAADEVFDPFLPPAAELEPELALQPAAVIESAPPAQPVAEDAEPAVPVWELPEQQASPASLPQPGSRERLELAIAYLDLGDAPTARNLLEEVVASGDAASRAQALELLGRLG
ncbi:hypothetical protein ABB30_11755 [Stenotrophomonas ginsengisoli]|uniref:FimV N-terminal domain-containing protein n=1 Tax=Stenotrophomonas ginsengisoli TaxID=336566 RepID=A0A0R0DE81_9GAMM|nr:FimV/HubP family polar landmark protein [Stenotrophomonas ginsengisoli]KRG75432.1 hypothetical protein ABB30_11755 [Stenotrophomonas ginsengisoli]